MVAMKKILLISFSLSTLFFACGDSKTSTNEAELIEIPIPQNKVQKEVLAENKSEVKMEVEGMTCAMGCAKFIEDKVGGMDGIVTSTVNFENKIATFEFDKSTTTPKAIQEFINNIQEGQYKAKTLSSDATIDSEESVNEDESVASVAERINISFPDLFTYFIKRIR